MAPDTSKPIAGAPRPDWDLPEIVDIKIRYVPFAPREHKHFRSTLADRQEAVEFLVRVSGPIPSRALAPALFVGDVQVFESEAMGENVYRFLALDPARLNRGAAIGWGWLNTPRRERKSTRFRFEPER
jgi:hypothetical protein